MIQNLILSITFVSLASVFDSIARVTSFKYGESIFAKMPGAWQGWLNPANANRDKFSQPLRFLFSTVLLPLTDLYQLAIFLKYICLLVAGMFCLNLIMLDVANWFIVLSCAYILHFSLFNWLYLRLFISRKEVSYQPNARTRSLSSEPSIRKNQWSNAWNMWKSIAIMGGLGSIVLAVLWIGRTLDGRGGDLIHKVPQVAGWPEYAAIGTASAIILFFVVTTLVKLSK